MFPTQHLSSVHRAVEARASSSFHDRLPKTLTSDGTNYHNSYLSNISYLGYLGTLPGGRRYPRGVF